MIVAPGETARLFEVVWNQTASADAEAPVQHGRYDIGIEIEYLYVDDGDGTRIGIPLQIWGIALDWSETE